jgi:hypothetical protein
MAKPKGKTPSLLTMSTGTPTAHTCGRATFCDRCNVGISKGDACFQIPKMRSGFTSSPIFCMDCTLEIIAKTKADIESLEEVFKDHSV